MENYSSFLFMILIVYLSFFSNISSFEWKNALLNPKDVLQSIGYHKKSIRYSLKNSIIFFGLIILGKAYFYLFPNTAGEKDIIQYFTPIIWGLGVFYSYILYRILSKIFNPKNINNEKDIAHKLDNCNILSFLLGADKAALKNDAPYDHNVLVLDDREIWYRALIGPGFFLLIFFFTFLSGDISLFSLSTLSPILLLTLIYICFSKKEAYYYTNIFQKILLVLVCLLYIALFHIPLIEVSTIQAKEFIGNLWSNQVALNFFITILCLVALVILSSVSYVLIKYYNCVKISQEESQEQIEVQEYLDNNYSLSNCYSLRYLVDHFIFYGIEALPLSKKKKGSFFFKLLGFNIKYLDKVDMDWYAWTNIRSPRHEVDGPYISEDNKQFKFGKIKNDVFFYLLKNKVQGTKISIKYVFYVTGFLTLLLFPFVTLFFIPLYIIFQFNFFIVFMNILPFFMIFYMSFCIYDEWNRYIYLYENDRQWISYLLIEEIILQELREFYNYMDQQVTIHFYSFPTINMNYMRELVEGLSPDIYQKYRERFPYKKKYIDPKSWGK